MPYFAREITQVICKTVLNKTPPQAIKVGVSVEVPSVFVLIQLSNGGHYKTSLIVGKIRGRTFTLKAFKIWKSYMEIFEAMLDKEPAR